MNKNKNLIIEKFFTLAGEILNSGKKYIITGCMHFPYSKE